jgi:chromosome segregation ATPase
MKPLNSRERTKAFYKVAGLFILCFVLAMLLGFSTMNVNKVTDYATKRQLDKYKNDLKFQETVFQPNILDATNKLHDLQNYKAKVLDPNATKSDIEASLKKIMSELKADSDQHYVMYKNIVDIYFALESAYDSKFKLEEKLEAKEGDVKNVDVDLQRVKDLRDELDNNNKKMNESNKTLTDQNAFLSSNISSLKGDIVKLQNQLVKSRDSLKYYLDINKGLKQQINKLK